MTSDNDVSERLRRMFLEDVAEASAQLPPSAFGQIALNAKLVTRQQVDDAIEEAKQRPGRIGEVLMRRGSLDTRGLLTVLRAQRVMRGELCVTVGRYFIVEVLGNGATGVVYRAIHEDLCKLVAIKVLRERPELPRNILDRFRREATTAARLQHPNIVGVHDVGVDDDEHYIAMDLVEGVTLSRWLSNPSRSFNERILMLEKIARAVGYAHLQGVLHRDLKPENVIVRSDGEPVLVDFGLARVLGDVGMTQEGSVIGTPLYMAPEQVRGEVAALDARTDVYALGVMVYEAVSGMLPFLGKTPADVYDRILRSEPIPPTQRRVGLPAEIDVICLKCIEKDPACRYESADALADDLRKLASGEPIAATRMATAVRLWRRLKRRPGAVAAALVIALLGVGGTLATVQWWRGSTRSEEATYALKLQSAYLSLSPAVASLIAEAEQGRYREVGEGTRLVSAVDAAVAADETGVGESIRIWTRFLVRDPSWESRLAGALVRFPQNPFLVVSQARCHLRGYIDEVRWPDDGMRFAASADALGTLSPETTASMRDHLAKARAALEAARKMPAWELMSELRWIADLKDGFERFASGDLSGALVRLRPLASRDDAGTEATLLACYAMAPGEDLDGIIELSRSLFSRRPQLTPAVAMLSAGLHYRAHKALVARKECLRDLEEARTLARRISPAPQADLKVATLDLWVGGARLFAGLDGIPDVRSAVEICSRVIDRNPRDLRARVNRAAALLLVGDPGALDLAMVDLDEAVRIDDTNVPARLNRLALLCKRLHALAAAGRETGADLSAARADLERARELAAGAVDLLDGEMLLVFEEGEVARAQGRSPTACYQRAIALAERLKILRPGHGRARYVELASALRLTPADGASGGAIRLIVAGMDALASDPEYPNLRQDAAAWCDVLIRRQGVEADVICAAIEAWDAVIRTKPTATSHCRRAFARLRLAVAAPAESAPVLVEAIADFEKARSEPAIAHDVHEGVADALLRLLTLGGTTGMTPETCKERALKELDKAIAIDGTCAEARSARLRIRIADADSRGAREDLDAVRSKSPKALLSVEQPLRAALEDANRRLKRDAGDLATLALRARLLVVLRDDQAAAAVKQLRETGGDKPAVQAELERLEAAFKE